MKNCFKDWSQSKGVPPSKSLLKIWVVKACYSNTKIMIIKPAIPFSLNDIMLYFSLMYFQITLSVDVYFQHLLWGNHNVCLSHLFLCVSSPLFLDHTSVIKDHNKHYRVL